jgi:hypothetical protein
MTLVVAAVLLESIESGAQAYVTDVMLSLAGSEGLVCPFNAVGGNKMLRMSHCIQGPYVM